MKFDRLHLSNFVLTIFIFLTNVEAFLLGRLNHAVFSVKPSRLPFEWDRIPSIDEFVRESRTWVHNLIKRNPIKKVPPIILSTSPTFPRSMSMSTSEQYVNRPNVDLVAVVSAAQCKRETSKMNRMINDGLKLIENLMSEFSKDLFALQRLESKISNTYANQLQINTMRAEQQKLIEHVVTLKQKLEIAIKTITTEVEMFINGLRVGTLHYSFAKSLDISFHYHRSAKHMDQAVKFEWVRALDLVKVAAESSYTNKTLLVNSSDLKELDLPPTLANVSYAMFCLAYSHPTVTKTFGVLSINSKPSSYSDSGRAKEISQRIVLQFKTAALYGYDRIVISCNYGFDDDDDDDDYKVDSNLVYQAYVKAMRNYPHNIAVTFVDTNNDSKSTRQQYCKILHRLFTKEANYNGSKALTTQLDSGAPKSAEKTSQNVQDPNVSSRWKYSVQNMYNSYLNEMPTLLSSKQITGSPRSKSKKIEQPSFKSKPERYSKKSDGGRHHSTKEKDKSKSHRNQKIGPDESESVKKLKITQKGRTRSAEKKSEKSLLHIKGNKKQSSRRTKLEFEDSDDTKTKLSSVHQKSRAPSAKANFEKSSRKVFFSSSSTTAPDLSFTGIHSPRELSLKPNLAFGLQLAQPTCINPSSRNADRMLTSVDSRNYTELDNRNDTQPVPFQPGLPLTYLLLPNNKRSSSHHGSGSDNSKSFIETLNSNDESAKEFMRNMEMILGQLKPTAINPLAADSHIWHLEMNRRNSSNTSSVQNSADILEENIGSNLGSEEERRESGRQKEKKKSRRKSKKDKKE